MSSGGEAEARIDWETPWRYAEFRGNVAPRTSVFIGYVLRRYGEAGLSPYEIYKYVRGIFAEYLPNFKHPSYDEVRTMLYVLRHVKPPLITRAGVARSTSRPYFSKVLYKLTPEGLDPRYDYIWRNPFDVFREQRRGRGPARGVRQFGIPRQPAGPQRGRRGRSQEVSARELQVPEAQAQAAEGKGARRRKREEVTGRTEVGKGLTIADAVDALYVPALAYFVAGDRKYLDAAAEELRSANVALDVDCIVEKVTDAIDGLDLGRMALDSGEKGKLGHPDATEAALRILRDRLYGVIDPGDVGESVRRAMGEILRGAMAGGVADAAPLVISEKLAGTLKTADIADAYVMLADELLGTESGARYYLSVMSSLYRKYEVNPLEERGRDEVRVRVNAAIDEVARRIYDRYFGSEKMDSLLAVMLSTVGEPGMSIDQYREHVGDRYTFVGEFKATLMEYGA